MLVKIDGSQAIKVPTYLIFKVSYLEPGAVIGFPATQYCRHFYLK